MFCKFLERPLFYFTSSFLICFLCTACKRIVSQTLKNAFVLTDLLSCPECPAKSHLSIWQPLILWSSCLTSSSCWRMLWNIVAYFVSKLYPLAQNSRSIRELKSSYWCLVGKVCRKIGIQLELKCKSTGFQNYFSTPLPDSNSCSPETGLQPVWHTAVQLVLKSLPVPISTRTEKIFCFITKHYMFSYYIQAERSEADNAQLLPSFYIILPT